MRARPKLSAARMPNATGCLTEIGLPDSEATTCTSGGCDSLGIVIVGEAVTVGKMSAIVGLKVSVGESVVVGAIIKVGNGVLVGCVGNSGRYAGVAVGDEIQPASVDTPSAHTSTKITFAILE